MSYKDGIANNTGKIGETEADQFFKNNGLHSWKPPGPDIGIDRIVNLNSSPRLQAKIQVKGRRQVQNPRWFQLSITPTQIIKASNDKIDLNDLWKKKIDIVDFWILVSIPNKEIWVFPSRVIHEIAELNYPIYKSRKDNDYSQVHYANKGKIAKKQKELNLDIKDKNGILITERFLFLKNNISPLLDFLNEKI
jgi:hypothetical protein